LAGRVEDFSFSMNDPLLTRLLDLNGLPPPLLGLAIFSFICVSNIKLNYNLSSSFIFLVYNSVDYCLDKFTNNISSKDVIENGLQERIGE
jgi:hypothetical protein